MSGPLDSITGALISKALDVSLMTQQTIANNIANSDTGGYRPLKVNFDSVMEQVKSAMTSGSGYDDVKAALDAVDFSPEEDTVATTVLLDEQIVQMVQNTTRYEALLGARDRLGDIMSLAIKGGRG